MTNEEMIIKELNEINRKLDEILMELRSTRHAESFLKNRNADESTVSEFLCQLGVPRALLGFKYLRDIILILLEDNKNMLISEVYDEVAKKHGIVGIHKIERAIRYVKERTIQYGNQELLSKIYGENVTKLTNKEFIKTIVIKFTL